MKKYLFFFYIIINFFIYSNNYFYFNKEKLISEINILLNNKKFDETQLYNITKIFFNLSILSELSQDEIQYRKYLEQVTEYGEKYLTFNKKNNEIIYYLAYCYNKLINSVDTYFKYKDKVTKYSQLMKKNDKNSLYSLVFESYYHSTFDERAGANRNLGKINLNKLLTLYPYNELSYETASYIYFEQYDFDKSTQFCLKTLEINKENLIVIERLKILEIFKRKPKIKSITFLETEQLNEKILNNFIKDIKNNELLTPELLRKIKSNLNKYRLLLNVDFKIKEVDNEYVELQLKLKSDAREVLNISVGYEFVFDYKDIITESRAINGIFPPVFYYNNSDLFKTGLIDFTFYCASLLMWNIEAKFNLFEIIDINLGLNFWDLPFFYSLNDNSQFKINISSIDYFYFNPSVGINKRINPYKLDFSFNYKPSFIIFNFLSFNNKIEDQNNFIFPEQFIIEHKLNFDITLNLINMMELGWVRKGYYVNISIDWIKNHPDKIWGYKNFLNNPTNYCFIFNFYGEYSDFFENFFYVSLGFRYKGGINLYKKNRIGIGKGTIGTPFGFEIKIHGFDRNYYYVDHIFLFNSLFGFKISKYFHFGFYLDICDFFEKYASSSIIKLNNSNYYNNLLIGIGHYAKFTIGYMLDFLFETSIGLDIGEQRIYGPVIGFYLQKVFIFDRK